MKPIENWNLKDWNCTKRISGQIRLNEKKINLCGELEMRNRLFQESCAKDCQEIEELRRICCEETDRARQLRIDEMFMHQERNPPTTASQLITQIQDLQSKVHSLSDAREFYDPETAISSGAPHVPSQPLNIPSPRDMRSRDSRLPRDTRNIMGTSGNFFESVLAREGPSSAIRENARNLASSSSPNLRQTTTVNTIPEEMITDTDRK